ncbi:hypothetical protein F2Q70_00035123 [Brassica cretica]|uniref:beta-galactosidase n=1 Tax=Brassica cretica TaxID=69181 RepID=A0A8S9JUD0_BRACR|nr:hypothetical protein F2Q70_00035123 [Brassica cretica]
MVNSSFLLADFEVTFHECEKRRPKEMICSVFLSMDFEDWSRRYSRVFLAREPETWRIVRFTEFGGAVPYRPAEDIAFSVARFIQNGGSFINYYMYHGGTNFDRTAGEFMATSYDYDAPLDEYGLPREPKYSHLTKLHKVIKLCEPALVSVDPTVTSLGDKQEAHVFKSKSSCAAFLSNYNTSSAARVSFGGATYDLPPWSVSILPNCKTEYYNTAKVRTPSIQMKMVPTNTQLSWGSYSEEIPSPNYNGTFAKDGLVEQISITRDKTDYFWYLTDITISADEKFLKTGEDPLLTIGSAGHALSVFVNGQFELLMDHWRNQS